MTSSLALDTDTRRSDDDTRRRRAFRAAGRHSTLVKLLKMVMVVGSVLLVGGIVAIYIFDPFRKIGNISEFSVASVGFSGAKLTMQKPHLAGFRQDGRPYEMWAQTMTQSAKKPNAFDMKLVEGVIGMAEKGSATVTAKTGFYDNDSLDLDGDVHVRSNQGYEAFLQTAHVDFKRNSVSSNQPIRAAMNTTTVTADSMSVVDNGKHLLFDGHVKTHIISPQTAKATTQNLKGTSP